MDINAAAMQAARDFLGRVRMLRNRIENKMLRIETLRDMATNTTSQVSDMPRSDSPNLQRMETVMCKVVDLEREIAEDRDAMEEAKEQIAAALCELDDYREQRVLYERYVECAAWAAIIVECGYARSSVYRYHDTGIEHLAVILERRSA